MQMTYWLVASGYLLFGAALAWVVPGKARWLLTAAVAILGVALLMPVRCRSLPMLACSQRALDQCELTGSSCSTLVGLHPPIVQSWGTSSAYVFATMVVASAVLLSWSLLVGPLRRLRLRGPGQRRFDGSALSS